MTKTVKRALQVAVLFVFLPKHLSSIAHTNNQTANLETVLDLEFLFDIFILIDGKNFKSSQPLHAEFVLKIFL